MYYKQELHLSSKLLVIYELPVGFPKLTKKTNIYEEIFINEMNHGRSKRANRIEKRWQVPRWLAHHIVLLPYGSYV